MRRSELARMLVFVGPSLLGCSSLKIKASEQARTYGAGREHPGKLGPTERGESIRASPDSQKTASAGGELQRGNDATFLAGPHTDLPAVKLAQAAYD